MLKHLGFGSKWIKWIKQILNTVSTLVILNGVPGKTMKCKCGVRQGDPLSPLLYVLVAELLQILMNEAWHNGDLRLPIQDHNCRNYPIIQYADDTLIIMPTEPTQLKHFMQISNYRKTNGIMIY